jgi:hypothetical protein
MWIKPAAEQQFLYGHNVLKSGLGRITESTTQYQGVIVFSMSDVPLVKTIIIFVILFLSHIFIYLLTYLLFR